MAWTGSTHCTTTSERRRLSLDALPKGWLTLLSVMMLALFLSLPSLACAGDSYSDELRLLDLELECRRSNPRCFRSNGRRSRPRAGRLQGSESSCTRTVEPDIAQGYSGRYKAASPYSNWTILPFSTLSPSSPRCARPGCSRRIDSRRCQRSNARGCGV